MKIGDAFKTWSGVAILVGAMVFSIVRVSINEMRFEAADITTIRLCHWQLESGFREALQELIDAYEKYYFETHGKRVRVLQMPVSERGYAQFVNTGLIGGTAPDIIEKGFADTANEPSYVARFFKPLSAFLDQPNPYNEGTPLEGVPWKDTFFDGMQNAYDRQLLDYYYIPFSMFTERMFYNKDLYHEATGREEAPATYDAFIEACEEIQAYAQERDLLLVPIAGSQYQARVIQRNFDRPFMVSIIRKTDLNFNGETGKLEAYLGYKQGDWSYDSPAIEASWTCNREISQFYQKGWIAVKRDDAVFMFVQGRAVMFASGSWDTSSLKAQVGDSFELDVFELPFPVDHPVYGRFVKGGHSEAATGGGINWAINQTSRQKDLCIDFLRFCTTRDRNSRFNTFITWLPIIRGTTFDGLLKKFKPNVRGFAGRFDMTVSTEIQLKNGGFTFSLLAGQMTIPEYQQKMTEIFERTAEDGFLTELRKRERNNRNLERVWASYYAGAYFPTGLTPPEASEKAAQITQAMQDFQFDLSMYAHQFESVNRESEEP